MDKTERMLDIAKRRGFFWQDSLIHGAMAGFYDYAHLGCLLKNKWQDVWREFFLGLDDNFYEISTCHIMPEHVFKASGHLASFVDPIVRCRKCGNTERADHIIEDALKESFEGASLERMSQIIKEHNIRCPKCKGPFEETGILNMMFPLSVGTGAEVRKGYLGPETAQGAYINFRLEFECLRRKLPMGLAIIGKAYRNEISPRNARGSSPRLSCRCSLTRIP
jgi:glycyl-tRNA synthetase